jgi:hypothetical protein
MSFSRFGNTSSGSWKSCPEGADHQGLNLVFCVAPSAGLELTERPCGVVRGGEGGQRSDCLASSFPERDVDKSGGPGVKNK